MLDDQYRPLGVIEGGGAPKPPLYPLRLKSLIYAFGAVAFEHEAKLGGAKMQRQVG